MDLIDDHCMSLLSEFAGKTIDRVRRIHFDFRADVDFSRSSIEITAGTLVAWFRGSGEHVLGRTEAWVDLFEQDPTEESRQIVAQWARTQLST